MTDFTEPIISDSRFEYKYLLDQSQYNTVRNAIKPFMKKDRYSLANSLGRYPLRSLYFDTFDFRNYVEKINGDCDRVKLRIRTYVQTSEDCKQVRAEFKIRKGIATEKFVSWVTYSDYENFKASGHWPRLSNAVLIDFERFFHLKTLQPQIIIDYQREGFITRAGENLRITFDHQVRSAQAKDLFPSTPFFHDHYHGWVVLEIKCTNQPPDWLRRLVRQNGLRVIANSKYTQGIEVARPDIVRVAWSA